MNICVLYAIVYNNYMLIINKILGLKLRRAAQRKDEFIKM